MARNPFEVELADFNVPPHQLRAPEQGDKIRQKSICRLRSAFNESAFDCTFAAIASAAVLAPVIFAQTQSPGLIAIGSPLTFGGTNSPDTYSATTTFSSTPVLVDNGAVKIWQVQTATGPTSEWDVFYMQTTNGGPLAGNINANWNILINYTLTAPVYFDQVVQQWQVNGAPVSPLTNGIGSICCASTSNPVLPGPAYYNSGFSSPIPAGLFSNSDGGNLWQQIFVDPYSYVTSGGINPSTANGFVFGLHFTKQTPMPAITNVISASAYGAFPAISSGSWIEIYGTNLAAAQQTWGSSDFYGVVAPTKLGGTSATVAGQPAFVYYINTGQINVQVPGGVANGSQPVVVTTAAGSSPPYSVTVNSVEPGLLAPASFNLSGTQYVVAEFTNGTYVLPPGAISGITSQRAKPGDTIVMYGIGFGSVTPTIPPGQIAEQSSALSLPLTVSIGGIPATVSYNGLTPSFVGLYQFNVVVPNVAANDKTPLTFSLNGVSGTQSLAIAIGN